MDHRMKIKAYINGEQVASFFDETVARIFSKHFTFHSKHTVELVDKTGMIGQYISGKSTPEFKSHHDAWVFSSGAVL